MKSKQECLGERRESILRRQKLRRERALRLKQQLMVVGPQLGLYVFFVVYTALGAKVFVELEHPTEESRYTAAVRSFNESRDHFLSAVLNITGKTDPVLKHKLAPQLSVYEAAVEAAVDSGVQMTRPLRPRYQWHFMESVLFSCTVLTTIGYGNMAPVTTGGRLFCILYGFIGIPLTLSVIAALGTLFANAVSAAGHRSRRLLLKWGLWKEREREGRLVPDGDRSRHLMVLGALAAYLLYTGIGGALFTLWEDWSFFEAFYFCFITMTTIGLGDVVPERTEYILVCTVYMLVGLALTSTIIELVRRQYAESWQHMKELSGRLGEISGPLALQLKRLGHTDVSLHVGMTADFRELREAMHWGRGKGTYQGPPDDGGLEELLRHHSTAAASFLAPGKRRRVVTFVMYETSV